MGVGQTEDRVSEQEHFLKVRADSAWTAICRVCKKPVVWVKTMVNPRWVLCDHWVLPLGAEAVEDDEVISYVSTTGVHWNHCVEPDKGVRDG